MTLDTHNIQTTAGERVTALESTESDYIYYYRPQKWLAWLLETMIITSSFSHLQLNHK